MNVLICTRTDDETAWQPVATALRSRGAIPWVLCTDRFPMDVGLTWQGPRDGWLDFGDGGRLALDAVHAIWMRREVVGAGLPMELPADVRAASAGESRGVLLGALADTDAFQLDPPHRYQRARNKALQLALARRVGLRTPATLETNDPQRARDFITEVGGPVVAKMYTDVRIGGGSVFTNRLGPDDIEAIGDLRACPMILQQDVPKAEELRVVCVGRRLFAVALPTADLGEDAAVDWRRVGGATLDRWRATELPPDVAAALHRFWDAMGMNYSSADLIRTPNGEHVLLESNGIGESFWLYDHHPLAAAIADLLIGVTERRVLR